MSLNHRISAVFLFLVGLGLLPFPAAGQAPLTINGPTDRSITSSTVNFSVPSTAGYTYAVSLDGQRLPTDVTHAVSQADYHELLVIRTNMTTLAVTNRLVRFIIRAVDRAETETGLPPWVPYPTIPSAPAELAGTHIDLLAPSAFPPGLEIPVIAWVRSAQNGTVRVNGPLTAAGHPPITMRRGVGSGLLPATHPAGTLNYAAQLAGVSVAKEIVIEADTSWISVSGELPGSTVWGVGSRIAVTGTITVPAGSTLTILEGSVVRLDSGVNITNRGRISIEGSATQPVVFTPVSRAQPWGGFFLTAATSLLEASGAIFVASCAVQSGFPGHRSEQPLFYLDNRARVFMTNCAAMDLAGQFHHSIDRGTPYATVTVVDSLIQRCTTAGEFNGCSLTFLNSALIEVPGEDPFYCADPDCDHDGFYLNAGNHEIRDSLVGWLKDDGFDAGSGGGPSSVVVSNCWVEGAFHEGLAWSGGGRVTRTWDTVLINNGQGIECGWSSGTNSPIVFGTRLLSLGNAVGARYGDNYTGTTGLGLKNGTLNVTNSLLLHNLRDVFGRPWDNTWNWRVTNMNVRNNLLTVSNSFHPSNGIWNAAGDAEKLAPFMTTPPDAAVGIGFATWGSQFSMAELFQGVPVRLSSFTTNAVTVNYAFETDGATLTSGSLTFAAGETVKRIFPMGFNAASQSLVRVVLKTAAQGELTGLTTVTFTGTVGSPLVSVWVPTTQGDIARTADGLATALSVPSSEIVTVDYRFDVDRGTLGGGTLTFAPGQTVAWASAPAGAMNEDLVRFVLSNPIHAQLGTPTNVYLLKSATPQVPPITTLIPRGAVWKYRDVASDPGATWRNTNYNDSAWPFGPAQLGFSGNEERDEATLIADNNQITSYFRTTFNVTNVAAFTNVSMWMLRDDAGVVHLNGREVYRSPNLPAFPAAIGYTTTSSSPNGENTIDTATINVTNLWVGTNWAAVEIHQQNATSSDVSFDFELLGNPLPPTPTTQSLHMASFSPGELTFVWGDPAFQLEQTAEFEGVDTVWAPVPGPSPILFTPVPGDPQRFFRLIRP